VTDTADAVARLLCRRRWKIGDVRIAAPGKLIEVARSVAVTVD